MIALPNLALLALLSARPVVQSVALDPEAVRPTLLVTTSAPLPSPEVTRTDEHLTIVLDADVAPGLVPPPVRPPLRGLRLAPRDGRTAIELTLDAAVPHLVATDGTRLRILFGAAAPPPRDVQALWGGLFPAAPEPAEILPPPELPAADASAASSSGAVDHQDGVLLGPVLLRPAVEAVYVWAESTFVSPDPVRDTYFEVRPRLGAQTSIGTGAFTADYEARLRRGSQFEDVSRTSHVVNGGLEVPLGTRLVVRASDHFARGTLETREVDPGGEYFFGLGLFRRNRFGLQARLQTGGRVRGEASASWEALRVDDQANFFDYDRHALEGRLGYELGPRLVASVAFARDRIPSPAERPLADTTAHSLALELAGELGPLTTAEVAAGLRDQDTPLAAEGGREFRGLVLAARLRRELGPEATLRLEGSRASFPSAFESNAFYLSTAALAELDLPAPSALVLRLAAGYHWNDYRTLAAESSEPRRDRIWEGAIGLARPLTRRAWVRADYRRERRNSNLESFDVTTQAFTVQVGIGYLGAALR